MGPFSGYMLEKIVEMAAAIVGGKDKLKERPIISFITCPISPLKLVQDCCEIIIGSARSGIAINILSMAMAGGSSPITLAGTLVDHNAEVLAGIVLNQLTCKGAPVVYGSSTTAMDLRLAVATVGTPECAMISAAVARLARYYSLPSFVAGG
jgi:trimethylamine--corrinoid protein Co-methyltransferase